MAASYPPVSPFAAGLACRCPRCGRGRLYASALGLGVRPRCEVCDLDLAERDSGDGPAVFVIFLLGAVVVGLALWVEARFEPPLWAHVALWGPFILVASILMLRPFKATLIALQYRHRPDARGD